MRTERLNSILLSTLLVTSLMVPLLTMVLVSVPSAQSYPSADNDHMDPTIAVIELQIGETHMVVTVTGDTIVERGDPYDPGDGRETIDTEIISMTLTSATPIPVTVNESPTKDSTGAIQQQYPGYDFPADSFFDVYVEIQTPFGTFHNDDPVPMETTINAIPPIGSTYESPHQVNIPLKAENGDIVGFIIQASHTIPPKYLDNLYSLEYPLYSQLHELYPEYCRSYLLTNWIDTNGDYTLSPSDKIDLTDENDNVTWWHVDNVTITMLVENLDNPEQKMYLDLDPKDFPFWHDIESDPISTWWHEIWPVFSRWYHLSSWEDNFFNPDGILSPSDIIDITYWEDEENYVVSWWHVLEVKYDIIVSQIQPPKYLDNLYDLADPISTQLHELYPNFSRSYDLTSWTDTNEDDILSQGDMIDMTDENGVVVWWNVDTVTITMLVENLDNPEQKMYLDLDPFLFPIWDSIKYDPISSWWHEIWPVFSRWYHLSSWEDNFFNQDGILSPSDIIDITYWEDEENYVSWWHVLEVKYDIIVQLVPPPENVPPENVPPENWDYTKENMPDLGQHSVNWCWAAAAANSIKWYAYHGYPELLDDPSDDVLDDNYTQIIPMQGFGPYPACPQGGVLRLLHEIAIDVLGLPEDAPLEVTFCNPTNNDSFFYGLQEFIDEQGAPLRVHEIVDNDHFGGVGIPPEDGENVIYDQPTFENYKYELERCQDVLLQLDFRNFSDEYPYEEALDHIVTGVSFFDGGPGNQWIQVSDPWTPFPVPFPGPDHNNDETRYTYENLQVVSEDPFVVLYTGETPMGPIQVPVQVVKLIYVSPTVVEIVENYDLVAGWNLISFPVASEDDTPDNIFAGQTYYIWKWDAVNKVYISPSPTAPVELGVGYWVYVDHDKTVTTSGIPVENYSIDLITGWNLIGFPVTSADTTPDNIFAGQTYYIWKWDAVNKVYVSPPPTAPVELKVGYWVWVDHDKTITVPVV